ncbi:hypothetical protein [Serratia fonticola]|uniref:hypothetical protein n=1 Tax=Serratia fonticola TaxID=47917 RepID=UPI0016467E0E|nr:hypothetical protein [Serratia fonticola]MBC3229974.1 hypothetical protein [Serratia fonticola]
MMKKQLSQDELDAQRKLRDIGYQKIRKEKLDELGPIKVTARLGKGAYLLLSRLCEDLGFPRPAPKQRNLVETYSDVITYLIHKEHSSRTYTPISQQAKELYRLHRIVSYLKHDNGHTDEEIIDRMKQDKRRTPKAILAGEKSYDWSEKEIRNLLKEKALTKKLQELDGVTSTSTSEKP